ncbi:MAG: RNA polymerase sigma factor [Bacilli bacterium]|nr:RNA polymerase sigma factor [Bacilli bacterium]
MTSENQLILDILQGNTSAYSKLMDQYHDEIYRYVYNIIGNEFTTDDIVQEIFIRVYHKLGSFDSNKAGFRTWLYRISHNYTLNYIKSWNRRKTNEYYTDQEDMLASDENIEEKMIRDTQINTIIKAIEKVLKAKSKKIIYLHYFSDLSPKEIAEVTKIPVQTVYKSINSSLEKIRVEVNNNGKNE